MSRRSSDTDRTGGSTRRQFLIGGAAAGVGAALALGTDRIVRATTTASPAPAETKPADAPYGTQVVPFHGAHQAGIDTMPQTHITMVGLDLRADTDREALRRMMMLLSDDSERLTQGKPPLADSEPELALAPARLTVTYGFGPGFVTRAGGARPGWLKPLPKYSIDRLREEFGQTDLFIQVCADDPVTVAHATRMLLKDARKFATLRWTQSGFRRARGTEKDGTTMRNLFGQVDGTANPKPGTQDFDTVVWSQDGWMAGGTSLVLRRIEMNLETWDELDRGGREQSVGRFLNSGAPLTGKREHDEPDFEKLTPIGFPVIAEFSHLRRSRSDNRTERIFRRAYNYDDAPAGDAISSSGLLFASFQADVDAQYAPLQKRLDELDLLNKWTTPIGSAVYAIPPGCRAGGYIGESLLA